VFLFVEFLFGAVPVHRNVDGNLQFSASSESHVCSYAGLWGVLDWLLIAIRELCEVLATGIQVPLGPSMVNWQMVKLGGVMKP